MHTPASLSIRLAKQAQKKLLVLKIHPDRPTFRDADFEPNSTRNFATLSGHPLNPDVDSDDEKGAVRLDGCGDMRP